MASTSLSASDVALIIYTSGTTGRPKGVLLDHGNVGAMTAMLHHHEVTANDGSLLVLAQFHVNAIMVGVVSPLAAGATLTPCASRSFYAART